MVNNNRGKTTKMGWVNFLINIRYIGILATFFEFEFETTN